VDALSGADGVERDGAAAELKRISLAGSPNPAARTPAPPAALVRLYADPSTTYVGIDVGEDFLDLAIVNPRARSLRFARVALTGLSGQVSAALAGRIIEAAPELDAHTVAMVDSPRWPCDLDWSRFEQTGELRYREPSPRGRELDQSLRQIHRELIAPQANGARSRGLSMFPTPRAAHFLRWMNDVRCKPHLRAIALELFGASRCDSDAPAAGGTFTRFMLAGFATYRALGLLGVSAFEAYPDLQLRLSSPATRLPPKRSAGARDVRCRIVAALATRLKIRDAPRPATLDDADAAALALAAADAARRGALCVMSNACEGRFLLALDARQSRRIERRA